MFWWCKAWRPPLGIGIDEDLLVNKSHTFNGAYVEGIPSNEIPRMGGIDLAMVNIIVLFLLQHLHLCLGQHRRGLGDMLLQGG